jgi:hypothetical protein
MKEEQNEKKEVVQSEKKDEGLKVTDVDVGGFDVGVDEERALEIRRTIMQIVAREVEIIERYIQWRVRELMEKGVDVNLTMFRKTEDDAITIVARIEIVPSTFMRALKRYSELLGMLTKAKRSMRKDDRYKYRFGDFEA